MPHEVIMIRPTNVYSLNYWRTDTHTIERKYREGNIIVVGYPRNGSCCVAGIVIGDAGCIN